MNPLESLLSPLTALVNRKIRATTPARELCEELAGRSVAVRVKDTGLAMAIHVDEDGLELRPRLDDDIDVVITGSLFTLARMATEPGEQSIRSGSLDLTGDAGTAQTFQKLLSFAKPDIEEELSGVIGDVAANRLAEMSRAFFDWTRESRTVMRENLRDYLQEESRELPSRYEVDRVAADIDELRDDVERAAARVDRLLRKG